MTHAERALYDVLGGHPLVERLWNGSAPVRVFVFALTMLAIPLHVVAVHIEDSAAALALWVLR